MSESVRNEVARQAEAITELREQLQKLEEHVDALYHELGLRRLGRRPLKVKA